MMDFMLEHVPDNPAQGGLSAPGELDDLIQVGDVNPRQIGLGEGVDP